MKPFINTILGTLAIAGLLLAGAEANNITTQLFASAGGVMLFAAGCLGICRVNREVDDA